MSLVLLEVHWSAGGARYALAIGPDGTPHLSSPDGAAVTAPLPAPPSPSRSDRPGPARRGKAWSEEDEAWLRDGFGRGETPAALASELGRSSGAVRARLVRMGLLDADEAGLRYPVQRADGAAQGG